MKRLKLLFIGIMAISLMACGSQKAAEIPQETAVTQETPEVQAVAEEPVAEEESLADTSVDIDLTSLSSTLIYSEVFNMMMEPLEYVGKTVKMDGVCSVYEDPDTGKVYYACIVQDATQCCSQGLEFVLDENKYQQTDYPEAGDEIVIKGTFATYGENGNQYLTMLDSELLND